MVKTLTLYIGNSNYSSWSLRPWLLMQVLGISFETKRVLVAGTGPNDRHRPYSENGLVPCLHVGDFQIWETLAIMEYLHEQHDGVWPSDTLARARARSYANEMHAGFNAVRSAMPMNIKLRLKGRPPSPEVAADIERISTIWTNCRKQAATDGVDGPWLFGAFCAADAMFAPVAWRFNTYNVPLTGVAGEYLSTLLAHPKMQEWADIALAESVAASYDDLAATYGGRRQ